METKISTNAKTLCLDIDLCQKIFSIDPNVRMVGFYQLNIFALCSEFVHRRFWAVFAKKKEELILGRCSIGGIHRAEQVGNPIADRKASLFARLVGHFNRVICQ